MHKNQIKLIVSDMDGTLLNSRHELDPHFFTLFDSLKQSGIQFAAASGRQYYNLKKLFAPIEDQLYFVAENGSYVVHQGRELHVQALSRQMVQELVTIGRTIPHANLVLCGKKYAYVENDAPEFMEHLRLYFEQYKVVHNLDTVTDDDILKFTICDLTGSESNSYPHFKHLHATCQVKVSARIWLDISDKKAHKGNAIAMLQDRLGISKAATMVFGDFLNDLEMMAQADFSYAMSNGHPDIRQAARFIAKSNDEGGVLEILEEVVREVALL